MKMTAYARSWLRLCHKMKDWHWKLEGRAIRNDGRMIHCPLSACGGAHSIGGYKEGGIALGFTANQIGAVVLASDDPIGAGLVANSQERRILLKAARLK